MEGKKQEIPGRIDADELEQVTGGTAWRDDPEAADNIRGKADSSSGGIVTEPAEKTNPVSGAGVMDRLALGLDRFKEELTSIATRQ